MKKVTDKQRYRDVQRTLNNRHHQSKNSNYCYIDSEDWLEVNYWIDKEITRGLNAKFLEGTKRKRLEVVLPSEMNFHEEYDRTIQHLTAIRQLVKNCKSSSLKKRAIYTLATVKFDELLSISTPAALVLTSEISKWDDSIRRNLKPQVESWDYGIYQQFSELGFFDLFDGVQNLDCSDGKCKNATSFVRYLKGSCGDNAKARELKTEIHNLVGDNIKKWNFLHGGLHEAITNVSHHAYPKSTRYSQKDRCWYLTGSFNADRRELKIAFYDQGVGIPKSLPASQVWEKITLWCEKHSIPGLGKKSDKTLLKAAVEMDRTSTGKNDRGKGLQDFLEFIKKTENGYLSLISGKGLYKFSVENGRQSDKTVSFDRPLCGTLIIWSVTL